MNGDQRVAMASDGTTYLSALSGHYGGPNTFDGQILLSRATPGGKWSRPRAVTPKDGRYRHQTLLALDPKDPDRVYVAWAEWGTTAGVYFSKSNDGGYTFTRPAKIFDADLGQAFPFAGTIIPRADGSLVVAFEVAPDGLAVNPPGLRKGFYVARSPDRGKSWATPVRVGSASISLATTVRDPVPWLPASGGALSGGTTGPLYATWASVPLPGNTGSVEVARSPDGGRTWRSLPALRRLGPGAVGAPTIATSANGLVGACWYDASNGESELTWPVTYQCATSSDRGEHWKAQRILGPFDLAKAPIVLARRSVGDYEGLASNGPRFIATFSAPTPSANEPTKLFSARFPPPRAMRRGGRP